MGWYTSVWLACLLYIGVNMELYLKVLQLANSLEQLWIAADKLFCNCCGGWCGWQQGDYLDLCRCVCSGCLFWRWPVAALWPSYLLQTHTVFIITARWRCLTAIVGCIAGYMVYSLMCVLLLPAGLILFCSLFLHVEQHCLGKWLCLPHSLQVC